MTPASLSRPLFAASLLSAAVWCGAERPAAAQTGITGSLPNNHPMKDGGTGGGAFGSTGSFIRSGSGGFSGLRGNGFGGGGFGGNGFGGGGFVNQGFVGGGFYGNGFYGNNLYGGGYLGGLPFGNPNFGGFPGVAGPFGGAVGLGPYGAYVVPTPSFGYGANYGLGLGNNYLGYPAYGGRYTNYGGNPNAFMMGPHRNPGGAGLAAPANPVAAIGPAVGVNPVLDEAWREEADRWRAPIDLGDAGPLPDAPRPADERELAEALRDERAGDEAFGRLDYRKALSHYRRAAVVAPTRGEPLYRAAFARVALGQFAAAGEDLRRAVALNPSLPVTGPSLRDLFGPDHSIARTAAVGGVAELARGDVRDADRLFLLGATMHANGDDRAREIFEAAWRLTGGRPHLRPYLDPTPVNFGSTGLAPGAIQADDDALPPAAGLDAVPAEISSDAGPQSSGPQDGGAIAAPDPTPNR